MRSTDIQKLISLKKEGKEIFFHDCPQCKRFFGTDKRGVETCSIECDAENALTNLRLDARRKERIDVYPLSKPYF